MTRDLAGQQAKHPAATRRTNQDQLRLSGIDCGAHKNARYEVYSYLVITPASLSGFDAERVRLRQAGLGVERRMSYKERYSKVLGNRMIVAGVSPR
jgi:hypothetical protein